MMNIAVSVYGFLGRWPPAGCWHGRLKQFTALHLTALGSGVDY